MEIFFENPGLVHIGLKILKDLDMKSLASCRQVCKSMNIEIEYLASNISFEDLEQLLEKYTVARSMTLEDHNVWHKFLVSIFDESQIGRSIEFLEFWQSCQINAPIFPKMYPS